MKKRSNHVKLGSFLIGMLRLFQTSCYRRAELK